MSDFTDTGDIFMGDIVIDMSGSDISGIYENWAQDSLSVSKSAHAVLTGSNTLDLTNVFWFKSDSLDISNTETNSSDLRVYMDGELFKNNINALIGGLVSDLVVKSDGGGEDPDLAGKLGSAIAGTTGGAYYNRLPYPSNDLYGPIFKADIVRFISFKFTGGYAGIDIFSNETELFENVATKLDGSGGVLEQITNILAGDSSSQNDFSNESGNGAPTADGDGCHITQAVLTNKYINRIRTNGGNGPNVDLGQMLHAIADNAGKLDASGVISWCPIPIFDDENRKINITFRIALMDIAKQNTDPNGSSDIVSYDPGNLNEVGSRSYLLQYSTGEGNTAPNGSTTNVSFDNTVLNKITARNTAT